ncbi:carbon monoxide dehydrogenase/acetyl-CoA synthase complex, corrinoid large subunit [Methanocella arvoryzae MRE50]|uniref:Acetyl-CoA decarbonylase/synthase complex subunit gamma n=1 Tax=Methanocella arvoryzae (strain DSM 22066 / NBRC 105507 / MRE50) TaxID=351160 RepID=Q0W879_METAR|nr:carbon monoxide dehydrogenase/acetyl-CoA synthase complex, corrinoid large subunit [Methanocella arvoryzae MRE50]
MKKSIREISPIDVYKLLPKTNCGECHEANCMTFATRVVNGELTVEDCPPIAGKKYMADYEKLRELMRPPVRTVTFGTGETAAKVGGKYVLYRHEFTYHNPPPIAIDVADYMAKEEIDARLKMVSSFTFNYIGRTLRLDAVAIRSTTNEPATFATVVKDVAGQTDLPFVLCAYDPATMAAGLDQVKDRRPLLYAATKENWKEMAELALQYSCPLVVSAPHDIPGLRSLVRTLTEYGISDLILDPGTSVESDLARTIHEFSQIRRSVFQQDDELLGYPLLGTPISAWLSPELSPEVVQWKEAWMASLLLSRHADMLIMHSVEGWVLLPQLIWRFNVYTDPRKPVSVDAGVKTFGSPDKQAPVLITSNYALTYFIVENDIKTASIHCYLVVADTGGNSVESAVAGRYLTAESISNALSDYKVADLVEHRHLVLPGLAARLSGDTEEASGWNVMVGPRDSSGLAEYLKTQWPPKDDKHAAGA